MNVLNTIDAELPARSVFQAIAKPPRRRRTMAERLRRLARNHAGMGVFLVMLVTSVTLVVFSR